MISRYVNFYSRLITNHLAPRYIRFPQTVDEIHHTKAQFEIQYDFPGILGVIDGTHIAITALPKEIESAYVNRKGIHSINTQIVCNADMLITNINARFPGSTHDAFIYGGSIIYNHLERLHRADPNTFNFILGICYCCHSFEHHLNIKCNVSRRFGLSSVTMAHENF